MQRFHASTLPRLYFLSLLFVGLAMGRPLVVLAADPNSCGPQQDYARVVPFPVPAAEPNEPWGAILGPVPVDPNVWEVPAGDFKRDWAQACDPEGGSVSVRFLGGTGPAVPQVDQAAALWSFAAVVAQGLNAWRFEASDGQATRIVTIMLMGIANEPPAMQ